ncbi:MAG TPA: hypothetical protein VGR56_06355 [Nitrososphaerales archaeon]|nr:hypothetical protein [Nitrososphaerales archaeon]
MNDNRGGHANPQTSEGLVRELRRSWKTLNEKKCSGTVAFVDLSGSSQFKTEFPAPDIWFERLYNFIEVVTAEANRILAKPYVKYLGDGVLAFQREERVKPEKFIEFTETLASRFAALNERRYSAKAWNMEFKCALDFGPDIMEFRSGDPQGTVIDRAFRIGGYLSPNMVGCSLSYYNRINLGAKRKFVFAGRGYLKGISERWQPIYSLNTIKGFSTQLQPEQLRKMALLDMWEMGKPDKPIWVVCGSIPPEEARDIDTYTIQHGDSHAWVEIVNTLSKLYPERDVRIVTSQDYLKQNGPAMDDDIVCVSGPEYNVVTSRLIEKMHLPLDFIDDTTKKLEPADTIMTFSHDGKDLRFSTERNASGRIVRDAAFFAKVKDAFVPGRYAYMMMGNETQGTYAATSLFGSSSPFLLSNHEFIKDKLPKRGVDPEKFGVVAQTPVIEQYIEPIELEHCKDLIVFGLP